MEINQLTGKIIGAAITVHSHLGPGMLETAYRYCLQHELTKRGLQVETELPVPVQYDTVHLDVGYRLDLLVESVVVVELKAVEALNDTHKAQLLTYMAMAKKPVGLLINFNVRLLKHGVLRLVRSEFSAVPLITPTEADHGQ